MPRNATILLHRCFDPSKLDYESAGPILNAFVRFPKADCGCSERVRISERNAMLADGRALVVLRGSALPSTDKFQWKEIVAVVSREKYKRPPLARTISEFDVYRGISYPGVLPVSLDEFEDYEKQFGPAATARLKNLLKRHT